MKSMLYLSAFAFCVATCCDSHLCYARPLEIIHTNDLHSHFEDADLDGVGGYAAVKATIDQLKAQAQAQGIDVLVLDAGDITEGTPFFLADSGRDSWRLVDHMGYDAVTIGNHDWLVGPYQMDWAMGSVAPQTPFLSANFKMPRKFQNLRKYIHPYEIFERAGLRIAVLGLSTNDLAYSWRAAPVQLQDPNDRAAEIVPGLRDQADVVIALDHLGVVADQSLIKNTSGIDLVVGGHDHYAFFTPVYQENPKHQQIPIVQAGCFGQYVGDLLVDVEPNQPVEVLRYQLVPVSTSGPAGVGPDATMAQMVQDSRQKFENQYGAAWLHQVITDSVIPMERPLNNNTVWGDIFARALLDTVPGADFSMDVGQFFGSTLPPGPVTREKLMRFYPRTFDATNATGYTVWDVEAPGWLMEIVIDTAVSEGTFFNMAGITYDQASNGSISNIRVRGKPMHWYDEYRIAVTSGIGKGAQDLSFWTDLFLEPHDTGVSVIQAVEKELQSMPNPIVGLNASEKP